MADPKPDTEVADSVTGYMCWIDFKYELGSAPGGEVVYPSVEALLAGHGSAKHCGIVEVAVTLVRVVVEGDA